MEERINDIWGKIMDLHNNKYVKHFNIYVPLSDEKRRELRHHTHSDKEPLFYTNEFFRFQGFGTKGCHSTKEVIRICEKAEEKAQTYHQGTVSISNDHHGYLTVFIYYRETDENRLTRLEELYNRILKSIESRKIDISSKYEKLKEIE